MNSISLFRYFIFDTNSNAHKAYVIFSSMMILQCDCYNHMPILKKPTGYLPNFKNIFFGKDLFAKVAKNLYEGKIFLEFGHEIGNKINNTCHFYSDQINPVQFCCRDTEVY